MSKRIIRNLVYLIMLAGTSLILSGCLFPESLSVSYFSGSVSISVAGVNVGTCFPNEDPSNTYDCLNNSVFSTFETLTEPELIFRLILLDPLVVQFPNEATNFAGSYYHTGSNSGGALAITAGLSSIDLDVNRSMTAEVGKQFVVIGLPAGAPTEGTFSFNLHFDVPPGTTSLEIKPIITGLVELSDGSIFYPPVLPCAHDIASAPSLSTNLPVPGDTLTLPALTQDLGCDNVTYNFIPQSTGNSLYLPLVIRETAGELQGMEVIKWNTKTGYGKRPAK
jgi:hypothetical protein